MTSISSDRRPRNKANDGFEFLREDYENLILDEMADTGNALLDLEGHDTLQGGIVMGLELGGAGTNTLEIAPGVAYTGLMIRCEETSIQTYSTAALADDVYNVNLVASLTNDTSTEATHPFSGDTQYKRKKLVLSVEIVSYAVSPLITNTKVRLGLIQVAGGTITRIGDASELSISTAVPYAVLLVNADDGTGNILYGAQSNKRFYRFRKEIGPSGAVVVTEQQHPWLTDVWYMDVVIPTDSAGTPVATYDEVRAAIAATTAFHAYLGGLSIPGTTFPSAGAFYSDTYIQMSGGSSHHQYYVARGGSATVDSRDAARQEKFMPESDTMSNHVTRKGHEAMTDNNPHGTGIDDIPGLADTMADHQRREHNRDRCGIARGSSSDWLDATAVVNQLQINIAPDPLNRAIVDGEVVVAATGGPFTDTPGGAYNIYTAEVNMAKTGLLVLTKIATWVDNGAANIVLNGTNDACLPIVAKSPDLTGTRQLVLTVTGAGATYSLVFDGGDAVDVSADGLTYRIIAQDGEWIDVFHEVDALFRLPNGVYSNNVVFVASDQNETALTVATATWTTTFPWDHVVDKRKYGTFSAEHETYGQVADALDYGCRYSGDGMLNSAEDGLVPFEVDFRGQTYRVPATTLASIAGLANGHNLVAVRFDAARNYEVIRLGDETTLFTTWVKNTDVLLGDLFYAAGVPVAAQSVWFQQVGEKGFRGIHIKAGAFGTGWDIDDALNYMHTVCLNTTIAANTTFILELLTDLTSTVTAVSIGKLLIRGNGHSITGDTEITCNTALCSDATFSTGFRFSQDNLVASIFSGDRTNVVGAYGDPFLDLSSTTLSAVDFDQCAFSHSGNNAIVYANAVQSVVRIRNSTWLSTGNFSYLVLGAGAGSTQVQMTENSIVSTGAVLNFSGTTSTLLLSNNYWNHSAAVSPIYFSGAGVPAAFSVRMYNNTCYWTSTDAVVSVGMVDIAPGAGNLLLSLLVKGNEFRLIYDNATTYPSLFRLSGALGSLDGGPGMYFSDNSYWVTAEGTNVTAAVDESFAVYRDTIADAYEGPYECRGETIYLANDRTYAAVHTEGLTSSESAVIDGVTFLADNLGVARACRVAADSDMIAIRNINFPPVTHAAGVVSCVHRIDATGINVTVSDVQNVGTDSNESVQIIADDDDFMVDVSDVKGRRSHTAGDEPMILINGGAKDDGNVSVSACHCVDTADVVAYTALVANLGLRCVSFCIGCVQRGGNPAVAIGFDVTSNHHVA